MNITENDLRHCYVDTCRKTIPALRNLREKDYRMKLQEIDALFSNRLWVSEKVTSGHRQFTHQVTGVTVEYQAHIKGKDNIVTATIQKQLLSQLQEHVNILSNEVFQYRYRNWKEEPDYQEAFRKLSLR